LRALASGGNPAGAVLELIEMAGNTKFDVARPDAPGRGDPFWDGYRADPRPTLVLGCIRPGEEDWWFAAFAKQLVPGDTAQPQLRVVVAPRHKEKFGYFAERLEAARLPFQLRSSGTYDRSRAVVVLDQFGELAQAYEGATLSFIGASLIPLGGHNPLEAAAWGSYVVTGPSFDTYQPLIEELVQRGAGEVIRSAEDIERVVGEVVSTPNEMFARGQEGIVVWQSQQGATARVIERLATFREGFS
jgi:3-deoxy-D-manno-octulosonic-acid transferase